MKVYLVTESPCALVGSESLKIMKVPPQLEAAFLKEYAGRIITAGSSIQEVITKFGLQENDQG